MFIDEPLTNLQKTAFSTIKRLKLLGIISFLDLLNVFPTRYEDYKNFVSIRHIKSHKNVPLFENNTAHNKVTLKGVIASFKNQYTRRGFQIQKVILTDKTGELEIIWFNQRFLSSIMRVGAILQVSGSLKEGVQASFNSEEYEILPNWKSKGIHTGKLVPIYPVRHNVSSRTVRDKITLILSRPDFFIPEVMPEILLKKNSLLPITEAYRLIHSPLSLLDAQRARRRLAFDELFVMQLSSRFIKKHWEAEKLGFQFRVKAYQNDIDLFISSFPFNLTDSQKKVINQILKDLSQKTPMNRLLQGDVGSGKTVVAAIACYLSYLNGFTSLFMAPTEILAQQHHRTLTELFNHFDSEKKPLVSLMTGNHKTKKGDIQNGSIIVGTHALVAKKASFEAVGLVIIDEQHKFGVAQRATLKEKGINPHLLSMTATPIPRTVYLTLFGELSRSMIDELPKGRKIIKSYYVPQEKRQDSYNWISNKITEEHVQVFIVCPLIEESEIETLKTIKAVKAEVERLKIIFPKFTLGLLHGKLKSSEKAEIMAQFAVGNIHILVSTSVVEVGVDVPNATIIVIEAAERFGLAQLHQLRGRVGRSDAQAYCLLFTEKVDSQTITRLKTFAKISSGFELADYDLKIRGVGEMYGTKQHGTVDLKIASLFDVELVEAVYTSVEEFARLENLNNYPQLKVKLDVYQTKLVARD